MGGPGGEGGERPPANAAYICQSATLVRISTNTNKVRETSGIHLRERHLCSYRQRERDGESARERARERERERGGLGVRRETARQRRMHLRARV